MRGSNSLRSFQRRTGVVLGGAVSLVSGETLDEAAGFLEEEKDRPLWREREDRGCRPAERELRLDLLRREKALLEREYERDFRSERFRERRRARERETLVLGERRRRSFFEDELLLNESTVLTGRVTS